MFNRISSRLRVTYILLALLPLVIAGAIILGVSYSILTEQAQILQDELAQRVAVEVEAYISNLEEQIKITIATTDFEQRSVQEQHEIFDELRTQQPAIQDLYLLDTHGNEIVHSSFLDVNTELNLANRANSPEFINPIQTRETYFGPVIKETDIPQMTISIPLENLRTGKLNMFWLRTYYSKPFGI